MNTAKTLLQDLQSLIEGLEREVRLKTAQILDQEVQILALKSELWNTQLQLPQRHDIRKYKIRVQLPPTTMSANSQEDLNTHSQAKSLPTASTTRNSQSSSSSSRGKDPSNPPIITKIVREAKSDIDPIQNQEEILRNDVSAPEYPNLAHMANRTLSKPKRSIKCKQDRLRKVIISQHDLQTFTQFSMLPLKLQQKIWQYTLPRQGRIVELCQVPKAIDKLAPYESHCTLPIAFQVCRVSREEATKCYQKLRYTIFLKYGACKDSFSIPDAYMHFDIDILLLTRSKDQLYACHSDLSRCSQSAKICRLAIDIDVWDRILSSLPKILAKMTCLKTLIIVWDSAREGYPPGRSDLDGIYRVIENVKEIPKKYPKLKKMMPEVRFGTLSRHFDTEKKYRATIRYLSVDVPGTKELLEDL